MNSILVSIVVPVYNVEEYLDECVKSLVNQTLKNIEIILVDDGSTDRSGTMCDQYALNDNRVKVIHQQNGGPSKARNTGVEVARGEYLLFVDSDDYILTEACEKFLNYATISQADIIWGDTLNSTDFGRAKRFPSYKKSVPATQILKESLDNNAYDIVPWLRFTRRDALIKYNLEFLDGVYYEDQEYTLKLLCIPTLTIYRVDYPFYYYRPDRAYSITAVHNLKKGTDFIKVIEQMIKYVNSVDIDDETKEYAKNIIAMAIYHLSSIYAYMRKEDRKKIRELLNNEIKNAALYNTKLINRMRLQNSLFVYCPELLTSILKIWGRRK